jgi:hypothetical protein
MKSKRVKKQKFVDFLSRIVIQLESMFNEGGDERTYRYHLFILISVGIELLGAALDDKIWHDEKAGLSRKRFNKALVNYKSLQKYNNKNLYEKLRCGMAHVYIPKKDLGINMKSESRGNQTHNTIKNKKLLLTIEYFFEDFKIACDELIDNINNNKNNLNLGDKCFQDFMNIPDNN